MPMSKETILITGGAGFIGTNLIPELYGEYDIVVIDNLSTGVYTPEVHDKTVFYETSICDEAAVNHIMEEHKPKFVFHFAGLVSIYDCNKDPVTAVTENILGSSIVFNACVNNKVEKVIFSESSAVYENCPLPQHGYLEEQSDPTTIYATTKASVALLAQSLQRTKGLKYTALRYFNVAGPKQDYKRTVPPLFAGVALRLLGNNPPIIFGDGNRRRDFIHVDDVNNFHKLCLTNKLTDNQTFNLGRGESHSLYEICNIVAEYLMIVKYNIQHMPEINGEAFEIFADISKARALGWQPQKTIETQIKDTIDFLQKEIQNGSIDPYKYMVNLKAEDVKI